MIGKNYTYMEASNVGGDCVESLCRRLRLARCDDVHINLTCRWVSGRLLKGVSDEGNSLVHISLFYYVWQSHFGQCFCNSDHRFKLTGSSSDCVWGISDSSHINVFLNEIALNGVGELWSNTLSCIRDIFGKELPSNGVRLQEFGCLSRSLVIDIFGGDIRV